MEILEHLQKAKENKNLMAVYRDEMPDVVDYTGFPVVLGKEILVMARETDFNVDGYVAIRVEDVTYIEQVDDNGFISKILQGEKLYTKVVPPRLTDGNNWHQLLSGVQASFNGWLTAESISPDGQCFFLGSIVRVDSNCLYMKQVDALGKQNKEETTILLQDLVTVSFGGRYIEIYQRYARNK